MKHLVNPRFLTAVALTLGLVSTSHAGNFGINTFTPGSQLSVNGNLSLGSTYNAIAAPANGAIIQGRVGIGTNAPTAGLHVANPGVSQTDVFISHSTSLNGVALYAQSAAGPGYQTCSLESSTGNPALVVAGGTVGIYPLVGLYSPSYTPCGAVALTSATSVGYFTTSDSRLKTAVKDTHYALADLMKVGVKDYVYKSDPQLPQTGFIAQQLYSVFPEAVTVGGEDAQKKPWMVDYSRMSPLIVKAVQELKTQTDAQAQSLTAQVQTLKNELSAQTTHVAALEAENAALKTQVTKIEALEKAVAALQVKSETRTVAILK